MHVIGISWGKVTEPHNCDTQKLAGICQTLGEQGVAEVVADPVDEHAPVGKG